MTKNYEELWRSVTNAANTAQAVRTLGEILADKEGRVFISRLGSKDAELCIEILDDVGHELRFLLPPPQTVSSGHRRAQPQTRREASILRYLKETRRTLWSTPGFHDNNRKD